MRFWLTVSLITILLLSVITVGADGYDGVRISCPPIQPKLLKQIHPKYPELAKKSRVQGTVALDCVIAKDGSISSIKVTRGHPLLIPASIDAVKQWRYKPTRLNGQPVEVETKVIINFVLPKRSHAK